jgi:transcriptional regulator with XRE-family HTH domain
LTSREGLCRRLRKGPEARSKFVESHLNKELAFQLRSLRDNAELSQEELATRVGMTQNAISRLENPNYGRATLTTLRRLAATYDVGLVVRFVPFSQLVDWETGTAYIERGLRPESMDVQTFEQEAGQGVFAEHPSTSVLISVPQTMLTAVTPQVPVANFAEYSSLNSAVTRPVDFGSLTGPELIYGHPVSDREQSAAEVQYQEVPVLMAPRGEAWTEAAWMSLGITSIT